MASTESSPARLIALSLLLVSAGPSSGPAAEPRRVAPAPPPHRDHRPLAEADEFVATFDPWMAAAIERLEAVPAAALTVVVGDTVLAGARFDVHRRSSYGRPAEPSTDVDDERSQDAAHSCADRRAHRCRYRPGRPCCELNILIGYGWS